MKKVTEKRQDEKAAETAGALAEHADSAEVQESSTATSKTRRNGANKKIYFNALRIAYIAIFTALSLALRFAEFMILPAVPYLKIDFSDVFILICAYALGPVSGIIAAAVKEVLYGIIATQTFFVGELANFVILVPFLLLPSLMYKKHKGIKSVIFWLAIACVIRTVWSFPVNLLLNFPAFVGFNWKVGMPMFLSVWYWVMLFNLIKCVMLAVAVLLLYKSVSRVIHIINGKFLDKNAEENVAETEESERETKESDTGATESEGNSSQNQTEM